MRYLLVTTDFPPGVGGVQRLLSNLCDGLSARATITVVTLGATREPDGRERRYEVIYVRPSLNKFITHVRLAVATLRRAENQDVIICGHVNAGPAVLTAHFLLCKPYIVYVHAMEITYRKWKPLYKVILKRAKRIVAGSSYSKSLVGRLFGLKYVDVIHPSVDSGLPGKNFTSSDEKNAVIRKKPKIILTVGRIDAAERYKGHDTVIEAMPAVLESMPDAEYWIVGDGSDRPRLEAIARKTGVSRAVRFFGQVQDVTPFYDECDVFVMVAETIDNGTVIKGEGFGLVYIEAASFGKPVIAGDCGGATDAVIDGYTGFLIPPREPGILANRIVHLLKNPDITEAMGRRAKRWVLTYFDHQRQLNEFENILAETISLK